MFDPFKDFETAGYLRNKFAERDLEIVQELEHQMFLGDAHAGGFEDLPAGRNRIVDLYRPEIQLGIAHANVEGTVVVSVLLCCHIGLLCLLGSEALAIGGLDMPCMSGI